MKHTLDIKKILQDSGNTLRAQWKFLLPVVFFAWLFSSVAAFGVDPWGPFGVQGPEFLSPVYYMFGIFSYAFLSLLISIGLMFVFIETVDGKQVERGDLLDGFTFKKMFSFIGAYIIYTIVVVIGLLLFVIPGVYIAVALAPLFYLIVDKDKGPIRAIKETYRMTQGHWWHMLAIIIIAGLISLFVMGIIVALLVLALWLGAFGGAIFTSILLIVGIPLLLLVVLFVQTYIGLMHAHMYKELRDYKM